MSLSGLEKAILLTIAYSDIFSFPLTSREVWLRLITNETVSYKEVRSSLEKLLIQKIIRKKDNYYSLTRLDTRIREVREVYSQEKIKQAQPLITLLSYIPFVKAVVVTGSVSVENAKKNDDTDWLIITGKHSLWIARPIIIFIVSLFGKRREFNGSHRDNSWCLNMFLTEGSLEMTVQKRNMYTAYEICQARFLLDKNGIEEKFLLDNSWAQLKVANFWNDREKAITKKYQATRTHFIISLVEKWFNQLFFFIQYHYMKPRITREVVAYDKALFHPRDTHGSILSKWKQKITHVIKRTHSTK